MKHEPILPARTERRPRSAVSGGVGVAGLIGLLGWALFAHLYRMDGPFAAIVAVLACGVPMVMWSVLVDRVHLNPNSGIDWSLRRPWREVRDISLTKISALWVTWAGIAAIYCLGRWYWDAPYLGAMHFLAALAPPLLALSIPYVLWLDRRMIAPLDGCYQFGLLLTGRRHLADREAWLAYLRAWAVKGFFTAFMLSIVSGNWADMIDRDAGAMFSSPLELAEALISAAYVVDVTFAMVGYLLTMRPLDSHIRSANPYVAGWTAALICYPPFVLMAEDGPLNYHVGEREWSVWLAGHPIGIALLGTLIVIATAVYAWATMAFGLRFSNLTDRGILTHGPYRFTKHPAYLAKNISWWLISLPFLPGTHSPIDAIRNTVALAGVSAVYYWRARTEEKHLSADPAYREYAAWMARHGPVPRFLGWLRSLASGRRVATPAE